MNKGKFVKQQFDISIISLIVQLWFMEIAFVTADFICAQQYLFWLALMYKLGTVVTLYKSKQTY